MDIPVVFQLRTMENGLPTQKIIPFSEIVIAPEDITTSADGSVATSVEFKAPVYLEGGNTEYAICLALTPPNIVFIFLVLVKTILSDTFISNHILDLYSSHRTHLLGNQVSGKTLSLLCIEQTLLKVDL